MKLTFDVCVFGAGPAGAAVAARLADLGLAAVVLDRSPKRKPWGGESFTGAIRHPLSVLGLWEEFCAAGHVAGYEQRIGWGSAPWEKSSIFSAQGNLWHVDRDRFDNDLREALHRRNIPVRNYHKIERLQLCGRQWHVCLDQDLEIFCRYLVDATGRARALARRLGAQPQNHDRLIGFTALMSRNKNADFDHAMVIESTPHGWWYAAPVPQGHVLAFFTDVDLASRNLAGFMKTVAANSSFVESDSELSWLAVGDACASHDPLCGWGVCRAMSNGILAAEAMSHFLRCGDAAPLDDFRRLCRVQFDDYLKGLALHYSYEQRWTSEPFWQRRAQFSHLPV